MQAPFFGSLTIVGGGKVCETCGTENSSVFDTEICIHVRGPDLSRPAIFVFPQLVVCLNCGAAQFNMTDVELNRIRIMPKATCG